MSRFFQPKKSNGLFSLLAGIAACMLLTGCNDSKPVNTASTAANGNQLRGITLTRDYRNARLVLEVAVHNNTPDPVMLAAPFARLLDGEDREVPPFFLAFNQPPTLAAGESGIHELAFWLDESHLEGELWLTLGDTTRLAVKDAGPFRLDWIENQASSRFTGAQWKNPHAVPPR